MEQDARAAAEAMRKVRRLLGELLLHKTDPKEPVGQILTLLDPVERYVEHGLGESSGGGRMRSTRGGQATYAVAKKKNEEEMLVEHREGGSTPYRCPKYLFDAVTHAISKADPSLNFEELAKATSKEVPEPPEWQVRTILRFLANTQPPLVGRERNRYRPLRPQKFLAESKAAWHGLPKESK
jgi:hypothetical protein